MGMASRKKWLVRAMRRARFLVEVENKTPEEASQQAAKEAHNRRHALAQLRAMGLGKKLLLQREEIARAAQVKPVVEPVSP